MNNDNETLNIKLDSSQENSFQSFYRSLPEKLSTTIRLFDRSDFWTVHESDAIFMANEVFRTQTVLRHFGSTTKGSEYVVINRTNFDLVIRDLLIVKQYRVEVYKAKNSKSQEWSIVYKASPGNLTQFEDLLFGMNEATATSGLLAIKSSKVGEQTVIGISYCDIALRKMMLCQLVDDNNFGGVESIVVQLRASECLVETGGMFENILSRNRVAVTERKKGDFSSKDIVQDMNRLIKFSKSSENFSLLPEAHMEVALCSLSASIKYLELLADESNFGQFALETFSTGHFVALDGAASKALNLLPSPQDGVGSFRSLFSVLNRCRTIRGQKLLSCWIHQPLLDLNKIEDRLDIVEVLVSDSELRKGLHEDVLRRIPDLLATTRKLQSKRAGLVECYRVYRVVLVLPRLLETLESVSNDDEKLKDKFRELFCDPLKDLIVDFSKFKDMVEATIDLSKADENEFFIKPDFHENLQNLHEQMEEIEEKLKKELNKAARELGLEAGKTIKLESNPQLGYFFRITRKEEKCLRGNERTYRTIDAHKGGVRFRSGPLETLNDRYIALKGDFVEQQKGVVSEVMEVAAGYIEPIQSLIDLTSKIDVFVSLATASVDAPMPYVRPKFIRPEETGKREMNFVEMRHPCLERQDGTCFIPNDVRLSSDDKTFQIITGPNMGGKSTYIRSAGLIVLMAQMGCFVPCKDASLTMVDAVMARVGASDNQLKGVSTFMAEMLEMAAILKNATENSFVIVDELGRGTSTYDGFGLAWSIAKHIATAVKSFCLFATHFHELTSIEEVFNQVGNLHMTAIVSKENLTLLYKVMPGVCDQSFGIHVAELVHFPKHVIDNAKQLTSQMEQSTDVLIRKSEHSCVDEPASKKMKITLEDVKSFLGNVKEKAKHCGNDNDLWKMIQTLKDSLGCHLAA